MMSLKPLGSLKGFNSKKHQKLVVATEIFFLIQLKLIIYQREVINLLHLYIPAYLHQIFLGSSICKLSLMTVWLRVHPTCWSGVLRGKSIRYPSPCLETARSPLFVSNTRVWLTFSNKRSKPKVMLTGFRCTLWRKHPQDIWDYDLRLTLMLEEHGCRGQSGMTTQIHFSGWCEPSEAESWAW